MPDLLVALREALSGAGPALLPLAPGDAGPPVADHLADDPATDPTALAVATSGSTGQRKVTLLPASALLASAAATHDRLGGAGQWLLALPLQHVAALQVLTRSLVAGTTPAVMDTRERFEAEPFGTAAARLRPGRRYTALVPTQLRRLLGSAAGCRILAGFDAVLVGGAALSPILADEAREAGVNVVVSYGMTETCGGCVYDGVPLDGVAVRSDDDGRIHLGGPTVARGYLAARDEAAGDLTVDGDGLRWFRSGDLGAWDGERLTVHGRADDVINTGGLKVSPRAVEEELLRMPEIAQAVVVGAPDEEWGERVCAMIVVADGHRLRPGWWEDLGDRLRPAVGAHGVPRYWKVADEIPVIGVGKPDRPAISALFEHAHLAWSRI